MSDEQLAIFFEKTGIKAWAEHNEISLDDIEIVPITNDIQKKLEIHQKICKKFQEYLNDNDNTINIDCSDGGYKIKLGLVIPYHSIGQMQYWGDGVNMGQLPQFEDVINRFLFYRRRALRTLQDIDNLLLRTHKNDGEIDFIKVQEIIRATIYSDTILARKIWCEISGLNPEKSPNYKSKVNKKDITRYFPSTLSEYFFGMAIGTFALSQMVNLIKNIKTQLWQSKIIEFSSHAFQQDTYMINEWTRKPGTDGTYVALDAEIGYLEKRYKTGDVNESASFWKYGEAIVYAGAVWLTDYIEIGPADCFEYINGMLSGIQIAKSDYGMQFACIDSMTSIVVCIQEFAKNVLLIDPLPGWLENTTRLTQNPVFKTFWYSWLFFLGSTISVFTELLKKCTMSNLVGGLVGTGISLAASMLTQKTWSGVNTATIKSLQNSGLSNHWTEYEYGDEGKYWKIKAYKVMNWLYSAGSSLRPESAFFETFYLSTYFPNIGEWAGPFDSMLPFITLTSVGLGLVFAYLFSTLTPIAISSGLLTAGVGLLICAIILVIAFVVLRILKAFGVFKQKDPSITGDD